MSAGEANEFDFEWRNAGNTADLVAVRFITTIGIYPFIFEARFQVENDNERFRITNVSAGAVAIKYDASIFTRI